MTLNNHRPCDGERNKSAGVPIVATAVVRLLLALLPADDGR